MEIPIALIERVFRQEYGRAVSALVRVCGSIDDAEEAVQEAFAEAVQRWPSTGLPPSPAGWIITTARNRAIDRHRREASREERHAQAAFLQTLDKASWQNTRVIKGDLAAEVRKMKQEPGPDMLLMGSGQIIAQLTDALLIDEYQIVATPTVLGRGRTMFEGVSSKPNLKLTKTRS